jgi:uncharacterized protein (TIGR03437 family)
MVGGTPADVLYTGAAPGLVAGAVQINVRIPQGAQPNPATPISLRVAGATTPAGVTVAVGGQ